MFRVFACLTQNLSLSKHDQKLYRLTFNRPRYLNLNIFIFKIYIVIRYIAHTPEKSLLSPTTLPEKGDLQRLVLVA